LNGAYPERVRRFLRNLGSIVIIAGLLALAYAIVVWQWNDPVTSLYTRYEQRQLNDDLEGLARKYPPPVTQSVRPQTAADNVTTELVARRLRLQSRPGDPLGRIIIPRLDLNMVLVNGTDHDSLKKGPGRDLRTYMPGEGELVYIAGHRTTYLAPFAHIDQLKPGDRVQLDMPYGVFVYEITHHVIVPADDLSRLISHHREEVALQACHPRFSAKERYIAYARPVGPAVSRIQAAA
jgi:sortase A